MKLENVLQSNHFQKTLSGKFEVLDRLCGTLCARLDQGTGIEKQVQEDLLDALVMQADEIFEAMVHASEEDQSNMLDYCADKLADLNERARMNLNVYLMACQMEKILDPDYKNTPKEWSCH